MKTGGNLGFMKIFLLDFAKLLTKTQTGLYNWLILLVVILEAGLFFCAAATVQWPKPALIRGRGEQEILRQGWSCRKRCYAKNQAARFFKDPTGIVNLLDDEHGGLVQGYMFAHSMPQIYHHRGKTSNIYTDLAKCACCVSTQCYFCLR